MDLKSAISIGKTAFELAKSLQNGLAKGQMKNDEVPARLMELQQLILDLQATLHDLAEENRQLIAATDREKELRESYEYADNCYYRKNGDGPFCPLCLDADRKLVRLQKGGDN